MLKKTIPLLLATVLLLCFPACKKQTPPVETPIVAPTEEIKATLTASVTKNAVQPMYDNVILFQEGSKVGVMDNKGQILVQAEYSALVPLSPNYFQFQNEAEYGCTGLMDKNGNVIVEPTYNHFIYAGDEYVLAEAVDVEKYQQTNEFDTTYYLLSLSNGSVIKQLGENVNSVHDAAVIEDILVVEGHIGSEENISRYRNYDINTGEEYEPGIFVSGTQDVIYSYYFDVPVGTKEVIKKIENWDTYDQAGKDLLIDVYHCADDGTFTTTRTAYELRSANGTVFDKQYGLACPSTYKDDPIPVSMETEYEGVYTYAYINTAGEIVIQGDFEELASFDNRNSTYVKKNGYWGLIDKTGKALTDFIYDNIEYIGNGFYLVEVNNSYGYMDINGKITCPVEITDEKQSEPLVFRDGNDGWYTVNPATGEKSKTYNYIRVENGNGVFSFPQEDRIEGLLIYEKEAIPLEYDYAVEISKDGKVFVGKKGSTFDIYETS